jgi:hypothetical protein
MSTPLNRLSDLPERFAFTARRGRDGKPSNHPIQTDIQVPVKRIEVFIFRRTIAVVGHSLEALSAGRIGQTAQLHRQAIHQMHVLLKRRQRRRQWLLKLLFVVPQIGTVADETTATGQLWKPTEHIELAKIDTNFDSIRKHPQFRALMAKYSSLSA